MRTALLSLSLLVVAFPLPAQDEGTRPRYNGNGHVFAAIGVCQHAVALLGLGGGGEGFLYRGLSVGADFGLYSFTDTNPFGIASVNGSYHSAGRDQRPGADPFVTGGWSTAFVCGRFYGRGGNIGAGLNYWFKNRVGIRCEARGYGIEGELMLVSRFGVSFR